MEHRASEEDSLPKGIGDPKGDLLIRCHCRRPKRTHCRKALATRALRKSPKRPIVVRRGLIAERHWRRRLSYRSLRSPCVRRGLIAERHWRRLIAISGNLSCRRPKRTHCRKALATVPFVSGASGSLMCPKRTHCRKALATSAHCSLFRAKASPKRTHCRKALATSCTMIENILRRVVRRGLIAERHWRLGLAISLSTSSASEEDSLPKGIGDQLSFGWVLLLIVVRRGLIAERHWRRVS